MENTLKVANSIFPNIGIYIELTILLEVSFSNTSYILEEQLHKEWTNIDWSNISIYL